MRPEGGLWDRASPTQVACIRDSLTFARWSTARQGEPRCRHLEGSAAVNPRGVLIGIPLLLYLGLIALVPRLDISKDAREVVIVVGGAVTIAAVIALGVWAHRRAG